jgi:hypothetical protein
MPRLTRFRGDDVFRDEGQREALPVAILGQTT